MPKDTYCDLATMDSGKLRNKRHEGDERRTQLSARVVWNLVGMGVPVLTALLTVPRLVEGMGTERFGVLTLAWVLIGYFSVFDMGLGRALTRSIAGQLAHGREAHLPGLVATAVTLMTILGAIAGILLALAGPLFVTRWIRVPTELQGEVTQSIFILAATVPCVILSTAYRGVLEAFGRFDWSNQIRLPIGVLNFIAPVVVLKYSHSLAAIVGSLAVTRIVAWYAYRKTSRRLVTVTQRGLHLDHTWVRPLLAFSGWATVSTVIGPFMIYLDRFLIGAFVSLSAVAYYATPYDILNRLGLIPSAVIDAVFPTMSSTLVSDRRTAATLHYDGMLAILFSMTPPVATAVFFANDGLRLWLGSSFAEHASPVAQWIAVGVLFNSIARVALNSLYADGRAFVVAKLHLIELFPYLAVLSVLGLRFGIEGVAVAWTARVFVDMCALQILSERLLRRPFSLATHLALLAATTALMAAGATVSNWTVKAAILCLLSSCSLAGLVWLHQRGSPAARTLGIDDRTHAGGT